MNKKIIYFYFKFLYFSLSNTYNEGVQRTHYQAGFYTEMLRKRHAPSKPNEY
jgi:hypothetical protein